MNRRRRPPKPVQVSLEHPFEYVATQAELSRFCERIADAETIAFDTEFVSEDSYRPDLCLVQVAAGEHLAVIDPKSVPDLLPFWQLLTDPQRETIVHAGREEIRFCLQALGRRPHKLFDVQIAAGLIGLEYPAAYGTLINKLLNQSLAKGETRTNWRHRPLSERQLEYALQDVVYLETLRDKLHGRLERLGRVEWMEDEMNAWQTLIETNELTEQWRRVSGTSGLSPRSLAIVRELWRWREVAAKQRNCPAKRVLRDDLIVELARRQSDDPKRVRQIRGMERRDYQPHIEALAEAIAKALALPEDECPGAARRPEGPQFNLLGQFLTTALAGVCREAQLAPSIVGTSQDVRDLVAYRLNVNGSATHPPPLLARGWRAGIVGRFVDDVLAGNVAVRVHDPLAEQPLRFESESGRDAT